jgi:hypothetical protein
MAVENVITNYPPTSPPLDDNILKRVSWPAVFGGTLVALAVELLLLAWGLFIGFSLNSPGGIKTWAEAWYFVTALVALFAGGWVAARLSTNTAGPGWLHGFVTWGLTTVATFAFAIWVSYGLLGTTIAAVRTTVVAAEAGPPATAAQGEASRLRNEAASVATPTQAQAAQVASRVAGVASSVSLVIFGGILLGAIASILGGGMVGRKIERRPARA